MKIESDAEVNIVGCGRNEQRTTLMEEQLSQLRQRVWEKVWNEQLYRTERVFSAYLSCLCSIFSTPLGNLKMCEAKTIFLSFIFPHLFPLSSHPLILCSMFSLSLQSVNNIRDWLIFEDLPQDGNLGKLTGLWYVSYNVFMEFKQKKNDNERRGEKYSRLKKKKKERKLIKTTIGINFGRLLQLH